MTGGFWADAPGESSASSQAQFQAKVTEARKLAAQAGTATTEAFERFVGGVEALIGDRGTLRQVTQIWAGAAGQGTQTRNRPFWRTAFTTPGTTAIEAASAATVEFVDGVFAALVELVTRLTEAPAAAFTAFADAAQAALSAAVRTLASGGLSGARQCAGGRAHRSAR